MSASTWSSSASSFDSAASSSDSLVLSPPGPPSPPSPTTSEESDPFPYDKPHWQSAPPAYEGCVNATATDGSKQKQKRATVVVKGFKYPHTDPTPERKFSDMYLRLVDNFASDAELKRRPSLVRRANDTSGSGKSGERK